MKKLLMALCGLALCTTVVSAQEFDLEGWEVYGGFGISCLSAQDFEDVRVSDVRRYGSSEGSLLLPLADANGTAVPFMFTFGAQNEIVENLAVLGECSVGLVDMDSYVGTCDFGVKYYFLNDTFRLGAGLKAGAYYFTKELGEAKVLPGTTPPVILNEGTIRTGDKLKYEVVGASATPMIECGVRFTDNISLGLNVGYRVGYSFKSSLKVGDDEIEIDPSESQDFYEARNDRFERINFDPKVSLTGVTAALFLSYKF